MKLLTYREIVGIPSVAPFTGVWIETIKLLTSPSPSDVAPFTGVWIET